MEACFKWLFFLLMLSGKGSGGGDLKNKNSFNWLWLLDLHCHADFTVIVSFFPVTIAWQLLWNEPKVTAWDKEENEYTLWRMGTGWAGDVTRRGTIRVSELSRFIPCIPNLLCFHAEQELVSLGAQIKYPFHLFLFTQVCFEKTETNYIRSHQSSTRLRVLGCLTQQWAAVRCLIL